MRDDVAAWLLWRTSGFKAHLGIPWWSSAEGPGSIPGQGTKISQAVQPDQKEKKKSKTIEPIDLRVKQPNVGGCLLNSHVHKQTTGVYFSW